MATIAIHDELAVPLLKKSPRRSAAHEVGVLGGVSNLTKCVLGAGLLSMPRAFSMLGAGLGTLALFAVALLTIFTIQHGVIVPSVTFDKQGTLRFGTYATAVRYWSGSVGERIVIFMMIVGLLGFEASYLDIFADILLGNGPDRPGLLPFGDGAGGTIDSRTLPWRWLQDRRFLLAVIMVTILMPLSLKRHMGSLGMVNAIGLLSLLAFVTSLIWLAVAAVLKGVSHPLPLMPDYEALGDQAWMQAATAFGTLSVLLTANACHANMHPLMSIVRPFSRATISTIVIITICITSSYYYVVMVCSYLVFGQTIQEDILTNLSVSSMEPLVGHMVAHGMSVVLRAGYLVSVLGSAVLTMFPLRQAVADLVLGPPPAAPIWVPSSRDPTSDGRRQQGGPTDAKHSRHAHQGHTAAAVEQRSSCCGGHGSGHQGVGARAAVSARPSASGLAPVHQAVALNDGTDSGYSTDDEESQDIPQGDYGGDVAIQAAAQVHAEKRGSMHAPLTIGLLLTAYILAVTVPSIWVVISLVGSTMGTCCSFVMPSAMGFSAILFMRRAGLKTQSWVKPLLYVATVLGLAMFVNAFVLLAVQ